MKRTTLTKFCVLIAIMLTIASEFIVQKETEIKYKRGWPLTISTYYTDGPNGQVVYESSPDPDPYKLTLNFIFYLFVISLFGVLASQTIKPAAHKSK